LRDQRLQWEDQLEALKSPQPFTLLDYLKPPNNFYHTKQLVIPTSPSSALHPHGPLSAATSDNPPRPTKQQVLEDYN
jgi:hypothetical protein